MKTYIQNLAMLSAVITFGCQQRKNEEPNEPDTKSEQTEMQTVADSTDEEGNNLALTKIAVEGVVKEITTGKDGYTAKIEARDSKIFYATISRTHLHQQYKSYKIGDTAKVSGDAFHMEDQERIVVREIK